MNTEKIECTEDNETFCAVKPHNCFRVWKGCDFWHKDLEVQIRLEPDGSVYISSRADADQVSLFNAATISIEQLQKNIQHMIDDAWKNNTKNNTIC